MDGNSLLSMVVFLGVFLATGGVALLLFARRDGDRRRGVARLRELAAPAERQPERGSVTDLALSALPKVGALLLPGNEGRRSCAGRGGQRERRGMALRTATLK